MSDGSAIDQNQAALDAWKSGGGPRPKTRPDGWPTRADLQWLTEAERAIRDAVGVVEGVGASIALTDAVILLGEARRRVADHVEGEMGPAESQSSAI